MLWTIEQATPSVVDAFLAVRRPPPAATRRGVAVKDRTRFQRRMSGSMLDARANLPDKSVKVMVCVDCTMKITATIAQAKAHHWTVWVGGSQCKNCYGKTVTP